MKKRRLIYFLICVYFALSGINICASAAEGTDENGTSAYEESVSPETVYIDEEFDTKSGMYIETLSNGLEFISSIPNGASVSDGVYFEMPVNISTQLQKDGEYITFYNKTAIAGEGYYILRLSGTNTYGEQITGVFTFRIGSVPVNKAAASEYKYPKINTTASIAYDDNTGLYKYTLPNYKAFFSNVSSYGETVESASFVIPANLGYSLKRNGKDITYMENKVYTEAGDYTLKIFGFSYASSGGYEACYETTLYFTVYDENADYTADSGTGISSLINKGSTAAAEVFSAVTDSININEDDEEDKIVNDTLKESYFETANIYSQSFSTGDSFYTNIPNDGIVGGNVYFDMPYNMSVSMSKDGTSVEFNNKTYINDPGSYVMTVTDVFDGVTSKAKFSFRIQSGVESPDGVSQESAEDSAGSGSTVNDESDSEDIVYSVANEYDSARNMYFFVCGSKDIYMSVPNGMVSNDDVVLDVPDDIEKSLTKNGEETEYVSTVEDDGRYVLNIKNGDDELSLEFDIARDPINYLDEFIMPEGYSLLAAEYSDYAGVYSEGDKDYTAGLMEIEMQNENYPSIYSLPIDGEYDFIIKGSRGMPILSVSLFIDRIAPEITFEGLDDNMSTEEESVEIYCDEADTEVVLVDSSGNESVLDVSEGGGKISGKGKYTLIARDKTGNENVYEFILGGSAGGSVVAIASIVFCLVILVVIAIIAIKFVKNIIGSGNVNKKENKKEEKANPLESEVSPSLFGSIFKKLSPKTKLIKNKAAAEDSSSYNDDVDAWENSDSLSDYTDNDLGDNDEDW